MSRSPVKRDVAAQQLHKLKEQPLGSFVFGGMCTLVHFAWMLGL